MPTAPVRVAALQPTIDCPHGVFPEVPRSLALSGADLILFTNSRPTARTEVEAAAVASHIPIAVSNPVGFTGVDHCLGSTRIVGPNGQELSAVRDGEVGWATAEFDLGAIALNRWDLCQIRLRRPELCAPLVSTRDVLSG